MRMMTQQVSFAAGELSPRLYGRSDLLKYASGAELIENFIVRPEGGLMRRPGTRFAGATRNPSGRVRLVPFVFSTLQAYMLEFDVRGCRRARWQFDGTGAAAGDLVTVDLALITGD